MKTLGFISIIIALLAVLLIIPAYLVNNSKREFRLSFGLQFYTSLYKEIMYGILLGVGLMSGIFICFSFFSLIKDIEVSQTIFSLFLIREGAAILFGAALEELWFRGLLLGGFCFLYSRKWLWLFLISLLFGLVHAANPHASLLSISSNILGGIMYGLAFLGTTGIWLPVGLHFAWNFFQGPVFGFNVSGMESTGLISMELQGSEILTGGDFGPEASIIGIGFRIVCIAILFICLKKSLVGK